MKDYYFEKNKIVVTNLKDFNIAHILECGQVFRYKKFSDHYQVFSKNKTAKIYTFENRCEIVTKDVDYFVNYFDLNTNYNKIKEKLSSFDFLVPIIKKTYGIRILNQDPFEMIISFIISANNNIKRIQSIIEKLCNTAGEFDEKENFYAFPTLENLKKLDLETLKGIGLGYRANYLQKTFVQLETFDYNYIFDNPSFLSEEKLLSLSGVGQKVCDCILLFAFQKHDVFPVDTWIRKVYENYFINLIYNNDNNNSYNNFYDKNNNDLNCNCSNIKNISNFNDISNKNNSNNNSKKNNVENRTNNIFKNNSNQVEKQVSAKKIREDLINIFGELSGYAQQYLFYYERCFNKTQN